MINNSDALTNGCPHHLSQQGFRELTKLNGMCNCPVMGCNGIWKVGTTNVDTSFQQKMDRFYRLLSQTQSNSQSVSYNV